MYVQTLSLVLALLFGKPAAAEWEAAVRLASDRRVEWIQVWESLDVDARLCEAVVFPELMRYSRFMDEVELATLSLRYVRGGVQKSNFSVGAFQMKPSFVESLERAWMDSELRLQYELYFVSGDTIDLRRRRIRRISDEQWQCVYVGMFVKLMMEKYPELAAMKAEDCVRYLATAYNCGFGLPLQTLSKRMKERAFHLEYVKLPGTHCYRYSDLSVRRFREIKGLR